MLTEFFKGGDALQEPFKELLDTSSLSEVHFWGDW